MRLIVAHRKRGQNLFKIIKFSKKNRKKLIFTKRDMIKGVDSLNVYNQIFL